MPNASFQIWCEAKYTNRHTYSKQHNPQRPTTRYDVKLNTQTDRRTQSKKNTNTHYQIWRKTKYINRQVYLKQHKPQIITKYGEILWCKTRYTNRHTYAKQHKPQTPNTIYDVKQNTHVCKETQTPNTHYQIWCETQLRWALPRSGVASGGQELWEKEWATFEMIFATFSGAEALRNMVTTTKFSSPIVPVMYIFQGGVWCSQP